MRYNPAPCLGAETNLAAEVETELGWERVALEDDNPETPVRGRLHARFAAEPTGTARVRAQITDALRPYGDGHVSRVMRLYALEAPQTTRLDARPAPATLGRTRECARRGATGTHPRRNHTRPR